MNLTCILKEWLSFGKRLREGLIIAQKALQAHPEDISLGLALFDDYTRKSLHIQRLRQLAFDLLDGPVPDLSEKEVWDPGDCNLELVPRERKVSNCRECKKLASTDKGLYCRKLKVFLPKDQNVSSSIALQLLMENCGET